MKEKIKAEFIKGWKAHDTKVRYMSPLESRAMGSGWEAAYNYAEVSSSPPTLQIIEDHAELYANVCMNMAASR